MSKVHSKPETVTPEKSTLDKLKDIMNWLITQLQAGIDRIMAYLKTWTKTSKPVREVMTPIVADAQSDLGIAGEKCISYMEELDPEEQAEALGAWKSLWRKITAGAVRLFEIVGNGFAGVRQGVKDACLMVWEKLKGVFAGIGQAIEGFWDKLMSIFGLRSAHGM